jgi:hypothetical protein
MDERGDDAAGEQTTEHLTDPGPSVSGPTGKEAGSSEPSRRQPRRWIGPVAGALGIVLFVFGLLGFIGAASDHSSRITASRKRHALAVAQKRADAARVRVQSASGALIAQVSSLSGSSGDLTNTGNGIISALNAAIAQLNNGDTTGGQSGFQAQAGAVAALDGKLAVEREGLAQVRQRITDLQAEQRGR